MGLIVSDFDIVEFELEDILDVRVQVEFRQCHWLTGKLRLGLLKMVLV